MPHVDLTSARWRKSTYSGNGPDCVEVAEFPEARAVAVRDSKNPDGPKLLFRESAWGKLVNKIKSGEFDSLS